VFHSPYYEDEAQVKCSLSRSDGDSNRFLNSWWVYFPHKPHSLIKWATGHRVTLSKTNSRVRQAPPVPEGRSGDRGIQGIPRLHTAPSSFSSTSTNTARTSGWLPAQIVCRLRGHNDLSFQLSVGCWYLVTQSGNDPQAHRYRWAFHPGGFPEYHIYIFTTGRKGASD